MARDTSPSTLTVAQARFFHRAALVLLVVGVAAWSAVTAVALSLLSTDRHAATTFLVRDAVYLVGLITTTSWLRRATGRILHPAATRSG